MVMHKLGSVGRVTPSTAARLNSVREKAARPTDAFAIRDRLAPGELMHISLSSQARPARQERQTVIRMSSPEPIESDVQIDHVECGSDLFLG